MKRKELLSYSKKMKLIGFLFILPALTYFAIFYFYPIFSAIYNSFFRYDLFTPREFIGFSNYINLLKDNLFIDSLRITAMYVIGSCFGTWIISFGLALLLNKNFPLRNFYRTLFFLPVIISLVIICIIWHALFRGDGLINAIFNLNIGWLTYGKTAIWVIVFLGIWRQAGLYMIILLSGLNGISSVYYEAAKLDGASYFGMFRHITIPLLKPTIGFIAIISLITAVRIFEPVYIITRGGPAGQTRVLALNIYETAFRSLEMGRASAMSIIMVIILLIFTLIQLKIWKGQESLD